MVNIETLFKNMDDADSKTIFWYILLILIFIWIFQKVLVGLNVVFGIILATIIILYFISNKQEKIQERTDVINLKSDYIRPHPIKLQYYKDLVDFVFSIQDLYHTNPPAYEEMVDNIDDFLTVYEESHIVPELSGQNYSLAESKKLRAVNALQSLIFNIESSPILIGKLNHATHKLDEILDDYLGELYELNTREILKNGW